MVEGWDGDERRAIPIHILNHIDQRLSEHAKTVDDRLEEIQSCLEASEQANSDRHTVLVDRITSVMGKYELMEAAFIKTEEGTPDFHGHWYDHISRKRFSDWLRDARNNAFSKVLEYVTIAILVWITLSAWETILKGPK